MSESSTTVDGPSFYAICTVMWLNLADVTKLPPGEMRESLRFDRKQRMGRGRLISVDSWKEHCPGPELDPESTTATDQILTEKALRNADSPCAAHIQREQERARDLVEHVTQVATPANREVLRRVLQATETGQSYREAGLHQEQVRRANSAAREAVEHAARRVKRAPASRVRIADYNPRCVRREVIMQTHQGATIPRIGGNSRSNNGTGRTRQTETIPSIWGLARPAQSRQVQHPQYGRGVVLREREIDSGRCVDVEFQDGKRRTILNEFVTPLLAFISTT